MRTFAAAVKSPRSDGRFQSASRNCAVVANVPEALYRPRFALPVQAAQLDAELARPFRVKRNSSLVSSVRFTEPDTSAKSGCMLVRLPRLTGASPESCGWGGGPSPDPCNGDPPATPSACNELPPPLGGHDHRTGIGTRSMLFHRRTRLTHFAEPHPARVDACATPSVLCGTVSSAPSAHSSTTNYPRVFALSIRLPRQFEGSRDARLHRRVAAYKNGHRDNGWRRRPLDHLLSAAPSARTLDEAGREPLHRLRRVRPCAPPPDSRPAQLRRPRPSGARPRQSRRMPAQSPRSASPAAR